MGELSLQMHYGDLIRSQKLSVFEQLARSGVANQATAFERLLVTANGNLQRIVSSWFECPVSVKVLRNVKLPEKDTWGRTVDLLCSGCEFCTAVSIVKLSEQRLVEAVESGRIGLGQLFRHFDLLPSFELLSATKSVKTLYRKYTLAAQGIFCTIEETFDTTQLSRIKCKGGGSEGRPSPVCETHAGADVMSGLKTNVPLEALSVPECSPFERVILTANGNIQRLTSSYLNCEVEVRVLVSRGSRGLYERKVLFRTMHDKKVFGQANSTIELTDKRIQDAVEGGTLDLGEIFSGLDKDSLPEFRLIKAERVMHDSSLEELKRTFEYCPVEKLSLVRSYSLCTQYASLRIHELFHPWLFSSEESSFVK